MQDIELVVNDETDGAGWLGVTLSMVDPASQLRRAEPMHTTAVAKAPPSLTWGSPHNSQNMYAILKEVLTLSHPRRLPSRSSRGCPV